VVLVVAAGQSQGHPKPGRIGAEVRLVSAIRKAITLHNGMRVDKDTCEPARTGRTTPRTTEAASHVYKSGVYDRIMRYNGGPDGTPKLTEKAVAVYLIGYTNINGVDPKVYVGETRAATELGVDPKTLRKHIAALVKRGWVEDSRKGQRKGQVAYYIAGLIRAFRDAQPAEGTVTPIDRQFGKIARTADQPEDGGSSGSSSVSSGKSPDSVRELFPSDRENRPDSLQLVELVSELRLTHTEHSVLAKRLGLDPSWFQNHPQRFAAAHQVVHHLDAWFMAKPRIKKLVKQHTFTGVAGAVGFVLARLERDASQERLLGEEPVQNPAALFESALANDWSDKLPGYADDRYSPDNGGWSVEHDLWETLREMLRDRVSPGVFQTSFRLAKLRRDDAGYAVLVPTSFGLAMARGASATVAKCLTQLGFRCESVAIACEAGS
jgi:hypothetical protein